MSTQHAWCQCGLILYCGVDCQKAHWRAHGEVCKPLYTHDTTRLPEHAKRVEQKRKASMSAGDRFLAVVNQLRMAQ